MHQSSSRRQFLHTALGGIAAASIVVGFDFRRRSWLTAAARDADRHGDALPALDGTLFVDDAHLDAAQDDFGHIVHERPVAVLSPGSIEDIVKMVRYARRHGLQIAMRGNGHSPFGQSQVEEGIVIDSSSLADVQVGSSGSSAWVDAGPGAHWRAVLQASLPLGLTPPVLTDYQDLTVGGTLSVGGIGGTSQTFGVQADNVIELEVVTGEGERVVCSESEHRQLFNSVLAGLGQCALIVRARVPLIAAPAQVTIFNLFYDDIELYVRDQLRLLRQGRFEHLQGQVVADAAGTGWRFMIEAGSFFTPPQSPNTAALLAGLHDVRADLTSVSESYSDYVFRLDPTIAFLIAIGVWGFPHPWMDLFVPASAAASFVGGVVANLTVADTGGGPILFYPVDSRRMRRPLFRLPEERHCFEFSILRTADPSVPSSVGDMLADNRAIYDQLVQIGGTRYGNGAIPFERRDWRRHFGPEWPALAAAKARFDPARVLTPGQGIFPFRR
ncbi:MAG TPA: FAD-binding protein [Polyangiaceae bacterium]|nr:FAD-binding protein [Polyangiaceae bacterium]